MNKDEAVKLVEELLDIEEKSDIGNLTRRERAEFQSIVRELFVEKEPEHISVDTPLGEMQAKISEDPDNPGLYIELHPSEIDTIIDLTLVKYDEITENIEIYNWDDAMQEDYTSRAVLSGLEELLESEKEIED